MMAETAQAAAQPAPATSTAPAAPASGKKVSIVAIIIGVVAVALVVVIGGIVVYAMTAKPDDTFVKTLSDTPVLNVLVSNEKKGRIILEEKANSEKSTLADSLATLDFQQLLSEEMNVSGRSQVTASIESDGDLFITDLSKVSVNATTNYNAKNEGDGTVALTATVNGDPIELDADIAYDADYVFFKITEVPVSDLADFMGTTSANLQPLVNEVQDQWYYMPMDELTAMTESTGITASVDASLTDSERQEVADILANFVTDENNAKFIGTETLHNVNTYHFKWDITAAKMKTLGQDLADVTGSDFDPDQIDASFENLDTLSFEVWFDADGNIAKVAGNVVTKEYTSDTTGEDMPALTILVSLETWDRGVSITPEVPDISDAKDANELLQSLGFGNTSMPSIPMY